MNADLHLCPCCAAHLRIPERLHAMRCNYCDAELVFVDQGGVRGLAMLPNVDHIIPYSDPRQRATGQPFDGRELLLSRRLAVLQDAQRRFRFWHSWTLVSFMLMAVSVCAGMVGANALCTGDKENLQTLALVVLLSMVCVPLLGYVTAFLHGRAQLVRESVSRWL